MNWIIQKHPKLSIRRQCELLDLNRCNLYYHSREETAYNLHLMRLLDEEYTKYPFKGVLRMVEFLREMGHMLNPKRVRRLLRVLGLEAVYPKKNLSKPVLGDQKYPYLLTGLEINRPNQVWCADVTYVRLKQGFVYLVAVMDWYSRYVLSWKLSNSLEADFCIDALEEALMFYENPDIFNSDQGSQFTSKDFTGLLLKNGIKISMDGKGRVFDNIFIERLWRSVKYEEIYLYDYADMIEAKRRLKFYFDFYNHERHHQTLDYKKPAQIYFGRSMPVDYVKKADNLLVPCKVDHFFNVGPQEILQQFNNFDRI
jgi:putative transposase